MVYIIPTKQRKRKLENEKEVTSAVKKHKRSHGVKINANMTFISNYKDFKVNQWIAVAGLSDWYIGQVKEILSEETATINFMERSITNTCTFKWCSPPAVETTYIKTVIHFDFDNEIGPNDSSLRSWKLEKNVCNQSLPNIEITALVLTKCESLVFLLIVL
ncbi:unnamed protein product [Mytilus coruscus]|uniref:Uncharacterized protein n=1 Tax=Mytilus coruscus TaxID=42192 RepID=A0A6J8DWW2_MYTCO|nr:unnamed protein product [Mytilus coruscus]